MPSFLRIQSSFTISCDKSVKLNFCNTSFLVHFVSTLCLKLGKSFANLLFEKCNFAILKTNLLEIRKELWHLKGTLLPFEEKNIYFKLESTWTHCTTVPPPLLEEQDSVCEISPPHPPSRRPPLHLFSAPPPRKCHCVSCQGFGFEEGYLVPLVLPLISLSLLHTPPLLHTSSLLHTSQPLEKAGFASSSPSLPTPPLRHLEDTHGLHSFAAKRISTFGAEPTRASLKDFSIV